MNDLLALLLLRLLFVWE